MSALFEAGGSQEILVTSRERVTLVIVPISTTSGVAGEGGEGEMKRERMAHSNKSRRHSPLTTSVKFFDVDPMELTAVQL